jgi:hypothetical protein
MALDIFTGSSGVPTVGEARVQDEEPHTRDIAGDHVDPRDESSLAEAEDENRREVIRCTLATYRRPDRLEIDDDAPQLELTVLTPDNVPGTETVALHADYDRPVMLIFGSYT